MKLHDLRPAPGAKKERRRVGRGVAAGQGKTAGRGTKGQNARAGGGVKPYFEGGQLPLVRRLPFKRGFTNIRRVAYAEINLDQLGGFTKKTPVTPEALVAAGLIRDLEKPVVILGRGELDRPLTVRVHRISKSAQEKIEKAGGTVELLTEDEGPKTE
jgi:large subunit ribosomal protein L15